MTFSSNSRTTEAAVEDMLPFKIIKIALYTIMLFLSTVGNGMVIRVISRTNRGPKIPSCLLILNLAICDLATPMMSIPFDLAWEENSYTWPFGRVLCKVLWPIATFSATSASLTLAAISFDRYRFIMHPYTPRLTNRQVKSMIICLHAFSFSLVTPYAFFLDLEATSCEEMWPSFEYRKLYTLLLFLVQYGFPLPFMFVMYSLALEKVLLSTRKIRNSLQEKGPVPEGKQAYKTCVTARRAQNMRATKMFISVVLVFAVCMIPNQIFWLWTDFGSGYGSETSKMAGIICRMFTYANSVFNPVIYAIFSREFQAGFQYQISSVARLFAYLKPSKLCVGSSGLRLSPTYTQEKSEQLRTESPKLCYVPTSPKREARGILENERHIKRGQTQDVCNAAFIEDKVVAWKRQKRTKMTAESKELIYQTADSSPTVKDPISSIGAIGLLMIAPIDESVLARIRTLHETDC